MPNFFFSFIKIHILIYTILAIYFIFRITLTNLPTEQIFRWQLTLFPHENHVFLCSIYNSCCPRCSYV